MADLLSGMNILVLEDEFLIAMDVEDLCRDAGAEKVVVRGGLEGLDESWLLDQEFDAAILDLMLSGRSTIGLARILHSNGVPIVFASGHAAADEFAEFPQLQVLAKPFAGAELVSAVSAAAARRSGRV